MQVDLRATSPLTFGDDNTKASYERLCARVRETMQGEFCVAPFVRLKAQDDRWLEPLSEVTPGDIGGDGMDSAPEVFRKLLLSGRVLARRS